ncbi:RNI-like protein [Backusella circina FSU 941]|nr:RNI-like protein [Backusella circina FSU 941]
MRQNPLLIAEIAHILCSYVNQSDLLNLAFTCKAFYHVSCARLWYKLHPKSHRKLHQIKNTLDSQKAHYNTMVRILKWSAREECLMERHFFDSFLFPNLRELEFSYAAAQDQLIYSIISASPHLRSVNLSQCYCLSTEAIRPLLDGKKNQLERLNLYGCNNMNSYSLATLIRRHSDSLKSIRLTDINDAVLIAIQSCKNVKDLGLEHCDTDLSNAALTAYFRSLEDNQARPNQIRLRDVTQLTSTHLLGMVNTTLASLVYFDISECQRVTSEGYLWLARQCTSLRTLSLAYQNDVTDQAIQLFFENCHSLTHVNLSGCKLLTDHAFQFENGLLSSALETLNLSGVDSLSSERVQYLLTTLSKLTELNLSIPYDDIDDTLEIVNGLSSPRFYIDRDHCYTIRKLQSDSHGLGKRKRIESYYIPPSLPVSLPSPSTWNIPLD